ncbi:carboxypeptidase-like regulatory domain-containing protein [Flavobacteriaceae bacterium D16]|nr:carboxypeptidase-like regulatory domain-containing protein [Flavobacteriaceae bacterium D16]
MFRIFISLFFILGLFTNQGLAQEDDRRILRGNVLYRNSNVVNENVINTTSEKATITNQRGEFAIRVKEGDELVFSSINYQIMIVTVTKEILENNRLVVEVNEKVTELDEVTVSPENQKRFLELRNEEFKGYEYEIDPTTKVVNIAEDPTVRGMQDGLNFVNIFKALFMSKQNATDESSTLKVSEVLRQIYDDQFFVMDLQLPQDKIDDFLLYCDNKLPSQSLLKRSNEFELIEFLVKQSKMYLDQMNAED